MSSRGSSAEQQEAAEESRRQQVAQLHELLAEGVASLDNRAEWERYLRFAKGFHSYSFLNRLAILMQAPYATAVAGYRAWQAKGHQVRKGEKAIRVLSPITRRTPLKDPAGNPVLDESGRPRETLVMTGVKAVPVFDISQTDGPPAPTPPRPVLLTGEAPTGLWDSLQQLVEAEGFTVERGDCGSANGYTSFASRTVRVRDDVDPAMSVRVLAHELGHVLLTAPADGGPDCRGLREVEAESVAFMVVEAHGLRSGQYTFNYVTGWASQADGDLTPEQVVRATGQRVIDAVDRILAHTQPDRTPDPVDALEAQVDRSLTLDPPARAPLHGSANEVTRPERHGRPAIARARARGVPR
jgi:hypothetical protein